MQYGTVAKMKVKPGMLDALMKLSMEDDDSSMAGYAGTLVYQMDADANELYMAVVFESKEAYVKNAESPEQDARFREFMTCLESEPEWHDGTLVFNAFAK